MIPQQPQPNTPHWGICPRCGQKDFLSVPTRQFGWICIYCLEDLYPGALGDVPLTRQHAKGRHAHE
jgi:hypothetical protein